MVYDPRNVLKVNTCCLFFLIVSTGIGSFCSLFNHSMSHRQARAPKTTFLLNFSCIWRSNPKIVTAIFHPFSSFSPVWSVSIMIFSSSKGSQEFSFCVIIKDRPVRGCSFVGVVISQNRLMGTGYDILFHLGASSLFRDHVQYLSEVIMQRKPEQPSDYAT